jgi:molecular chaperone DnaK
MTRAELEELTADLIERLTEPCKIALEDAGLAANEIDEIVLVGGMTRMPAIQRKVVKIFGKDPVKGVNPDEVVAAGAAIQAGVLSGEVQEVLLLDVTPLTLGVETQGGVATPIIPRNTTVPTSMSQVFSTTEDHQTVVRIHVVQGEREMARDNKTLGRFELVGLPPAPRGVPQIEVTFDIDADGVVKVSAKDLGTGRSQAISVTAASGLPEAEIERLVAEAASHAEADRARRELIDLRNQCDGLIYSTERTLSEFTENVTADQRQALLRAIEAARAAAATDDVAPLRAAMGELSARTYELTERLYAELGGNKAPAGS